MLTLEDIKERLCHYDELTLLEVLNVSSEEIVERFDDLILEQYEELAQELEDENYED